MAKRVYTSEQKEARRLWQIEWRKKNNYDSWRKYYPKTKVKRQKIAAKNKLIKPPKIIAAKEKLIKIKNIEQHKIKKVLKPIIKPHKQIKRKVIHKKFETINKDLSKMKRIFIKELRMEIFIRPDQDEQKVREKYLKNN